VSCSIIWLIVAITPMFIITLMTSVALTAHLLRELSDRHGLADRHLAHTTRSVAFRIHAWYRTPRPRTAPAVARFLLLVPELTSPTMCSPAP